MLRLNRCVTLAPAMYLCRFCIGAKSQQAKITRARAWLSKLGNNILDPPEPVYYDEQYDPVKHLSSAVFPFDAKERIMVMLYSAYFDESKNKPDKHKPDAPRVYTIAGCVGTDKQWVKFQKKWKQILDRDVLPKWRNVYGADKPVFFHMTDFANPHNKIYEDWSEDKKVKFLKKLHSIMARHSMKRFATAIPIADYEELSDKEKTFFRPPARLRCY